MDPNFRKRKGKGKEEEEESNEWLGFSSKVIIPLSEVNRSSTSGKTPEKEFNKYDDSVRPNCKTCRIVFKTETDWIDHTCVNSKSHQIQRYKNSEELLKTKRRMMMNEEKVDQEIRIQDEETRRGSGALPANFFDVVTSNKVEDFLDMDRQLEELDKEERTGCYQQCEQVFRLDQGQEAFSLYE